MKELPELTSSPISLVLFKRSDLFSEFRNTSYKIKKDKKLKNTKLIKSGKRIRCDDTKILKITGSNAILCI